MSKGVLVSTKQTEWEKSVGCIQDQSYECLSSVSKDTLLTGVERVSRWSGRTAVEFRSKIRLVTLKTSRGGGSDTTQVCTDT